MAVAGRFVPSRIAAWAPAWSRGLVAAVAAAAAGAAVAAGEEPTGGAAVDAVLVAVLAAGAALAGSVAHPFPVLAAGVLVAAVGVGDPGGPLGAAAAGAAAALWVSPGRVPALGAVAGGLLVHGAFRLDHPDFLGGPSLIAGTAIGALLLAGLIGAPRRPRRALVATAVVAGVLGFTASLAAAAVAWDTHGDVDDALRAARAGLAAARDADRVAAADHFEEAAAAFARAEDATGRWWLTPSLAVPVVAQHTRAARDLVASGAELADAAATEARAVDPDAIRLVGGALDLGAVSSLEPALERTAEALGRARRRLDRAQGTPWLVDPITDRLDRFAGDVVDADADARRALEAVQVVPDLLGAGGPRRYFLAVVTPSEIRGGGGFMGNWGEITAVDGRLELTQLGRVRDLDQARGGGVAPVGPADYRARYAEYGAHRFWGNLLASPDFPTDALVAAALYPQSGGTPIDGVLAVDPIGLAAILELTGPVEVQGWPEPLTAENAAPVLLHEHYAAFGRDERVDFLGDVAQTVWARLTERTLPGPTTIGRVLGPVVAGRHIQLVTFDEAERPFLEQLGVTGRLPAVAGDSLGVVTHNASGNKLDYFLHRFIEYATTFDPGTGAVESLATIRFENRTPPDALGSPAAIGVNELGVPAGWNRSWVSVYSPLELVAADVDGNPVEVTVEEELGRNVYSFFVAIPPGGAVTARLQVAGAVGSGAYQLFLPRQPVVHPDEVTVRVGLADGWLVASAPGWGTVEPGGVAARLVVNRHAALRFTPGRD